MAAAFMLAGCGSGDTAADLDAASSSPAALVELADACPQVEDLLPPLPNKPDGDQPEWRAAADALEELTGVGTEETQAALADLTEAARTMGDVDNTPVAEDGEVVLPYLDAEEAYDNALVEFRDVCESAG